VIRKTAAQSARPLGLLLHRDRLFAQNTGDVGRYCARTPDSAQVAAPVILPDLRGLMAHVRREPARCGQFTSIYTWAKW